MQHLMSSAEAMHRGSSGPCLCASTALLNNADVLHCTALALNRVQRAAPCIASSVLLNLCKYTMSAQWLDVTFLQPATS